MAGTRRAFLADLFRTAVAAAHPAACLPPLLPQPPAGRLILLAAGKAAGSMAEVAEGFYLDRLKLSPERLCGVAVARHGYGRPLQVVSMIEAGHPIPDAAGLEGGRASAQAGRWRRRRRSGAGADVGRRLRQLDRAGGRRVVRRQAGGDARAAALGRDHRRDQHGAQTSLAHQRRAAGAPRLSGEACDDRDFRRAGRRSIGDRLGTDGARPDDARRCARDRRQIQTRSARKRDRRARRCEQ